QNKLKIQHIEEVLTKPFKREKEGEGSSRDRDSVSSLGANENGIPLENQHLRLWESTWLQVGLLCVCLANLERCRKGTQAQLQCWEKERRKVRKKQRKEEEVTGETESRRRKRRRCRITHSKRSRRRKDLELSCCKPIASSDAGEPLQFACTGLTV
ncbi:hypothetical protein E2320_005185, partial [Naja naja]